MIRVRAEAVRSINTAAVVKRKEIIMQLDQIRYELPNISAGLKEAGESL